MFAAELSNGGKAESLALRHELLREANETLAFQVRTGQFNEAPISVYFTIRQYWEKQPFKAFQESYRNQRKAGQEIVDNHIIPAIVQPLFHTIAAKQ